jgi:RimJ/RimL family protein N-acetyltransferase
VFEDNIQGLRFYEKLGFRRVGKWTKQVKIDDEYHDEILLEKFL